MTRNSSEIRVVRGLLARLQSYCPSDSPKTAVLPPSIGSEVYARQSAIGKRTTKLATEIAAVDIINLGLRLKAQVDQHRLFDQLKGTSTFEVLRVLALGELFCGGTIDRSALQILSDIDYSIANTSVLSTILQSADCKRLAKLVTSAIEKQQADVGALGIIDCKSLVANLRFLGFGADVHSLSGLSDAFYALKQIHWALFGSDLLVFMQALSDPSWSLKTDQISLLVPIAEFWNLGSLSKQLILLRSVNHYPAEQAYFLEHQKQLLALSNISPEAATLLETRKWDDPARRKYIQSTDPIESATLFSLQFYDLLRNGEFNRLLLLIRSQYERDPTSLLFLNWDIFYESAPRDWGQQYLLNILLSVILLSPQISSRFESIEFSYGEGFVTSQLINYAKDIKRHNQGIFQFARSISNLREKARNLIAAFVLQKSVIEVYAYAFRDKPISSKTNIPAADLEVCHARIRLAYLFRENKTLSADHCDRIIAEESAFRKMHRFQEVFRNSRIRIDWKYLEMELADTLDVDFGFIFKTLRTKNSSPESSTANIMATIIAQRLCELTLFDSATSLERALSNNLRHGVVIPRFLRVFTDAISNQTSSRPLSGQTNAAWYGSTFAQAGSRLFNLEEEIISLISEYQEQWLKVNRDGGFYGQLVETVASTILKRLAKGHAFKFDNLLAELIEVQRAAISGILESSRRELNERVRPKVDNLVSIASIDIRPLDVRGSREFLDSLAINLDRAFEQVSQWISLVDFEDSKSIEFEVGHLIDEESNTFIISDRSKAKIRYEFFDRRGSRTRRLRDIKVSGRAFDLLDQIIHNCLSNARKRSGLRNETDILVRVTRTENDLTIWTGNNFAKGQLAAMRKHQRRAKGIVAKAMQRTRSRKKTSLDSYKEGGYGFLKVIDASERLLGSPPMFNFPIISDEKGQFIVEIRLVGASMVLV
jgi:hypothetical protein